MRTRSVQDHRTTGPQDRQGRRTGVTLSGVAPARCRGPRDRRVEVEGAQGPVCGSRRPANALPAPVAMHLHLMGRPARGACRTGDRRPTVERPFGRSVGPSCCRMLISDRSGVSRATAQSTRAAAVLHRCPPPWVLRTAGPVTVRPLATSVPAPERPDAPCVRARRRGSGERRPNDPPTALAAGMMDVRAVNVACCPAAAPKAPCMHQPVVIGWVGHHRGPADDCWPQTPNPRAGPPLLGPIGPPNRPGQPMGWPCEPLDARSAQTAGGDPR